MRILLVAAANSSTGGGERHVADVMHGLTERGHDVALVAPYGGDLQEIASSLGVTCFDAQIGVGFSFSQLKSVRFAIEQFNPDIVHAHGSRAAVFARLADKKSAQRSIYTMHGIHSDSGLSAPIKLGIEHLLVPRTAAFVVTCQADSDKGVRLGIVDSAKTRVIYNGIPEPKSVARGIFRAELGLEPAEWLALHVGRLSAVKDQMSLIDAFSELNKADAHLAMICPGSNDARTNLQRHIKSLETQSNIHLLGGRADLSSAYADADVFVLSSLWEARPYVIVEAMSYGCPVISTDVGGVSEAVEDGITGILTVPKNPHALSSALGEIYNDPQKARAMGAEGARQMRDKFTLERMYEQLIEVYEAVASKE